MIWPSVPAAQIVPVETAGSYPRRNMVGREMRPMVTTVAPTMPVLAAIIAPTITTAMPRPPGVPRINWARDCSNWSASFDRSSITPMNTKTGTAIRVSLVMMP